MANLAIKEFRARLNSLCEYARLVSSISIADALRNLSSVSRLLWADIYSSSVAAHAVDAVRLRLFREALAICRAELAAAEFAGHAQTLETLARLKRYGRLAETLETQGLRATATLLQEELVQLTRIEQ